MDHPRNAFVDTLLAFNIFGQETVFSWIPESLLRIFFYRDLDDLAPQLELMVSSQKLQWSTPISFTKSAKAKQSGSVAISKASLRMAFASTTARKVCQREDLAEKTWSKETWSSWLLATNGPVWLSYQMRCSKSLTSRQIGTFKSSHQNI